MREQSRGPLGPEMGRVRRRLGSGPAFGAPATIHWIVTVGVISASTGMLWFVFGLIGEAIFDSRNPIFTLALVGAILGVAGGSWVSMALTDAPRNRSMWAGSLIGGWCGLLAGMLVPIVAHPMPLGGLFAILAPGVGTAIGQTLIRLMQVPEPEPPKPRPHGPYR